MKALPIFYILKNCKSSNIFGRYVKAVSFTRKLFYLQKTYKRSSIYGQSVKGLQDISELNAFLEVIYIMEAMKALE